MLKPTQDKQLRNQIISVIQANTPCRQCSNWDKDGAYCFGTQDTNCCSKIEVILQILENKGYHVGLPSDIEWALNSGDGTYRP
jgi:hypothetical protein